MMCCNLLQYERDFFSAAFCMDRRNLLARLSEHFVEYGRSGTIYRRNETVELLSAIPKSREIHIYDFTVDPISEIAFLVRYIAHERECDQYSLRTSIWRREEQGRLKLLFHQGTATTRCQVKAYISQDER